MSICLDPRPETVDFGGPAVYATIEEASTTEKATLWNTSSTSAAKNWNFTNAPSKLASARFFEPLRKAYTCYERRQSEALDDLEPPNLVQQLLDATRHKSRIITGRERLTAIRTVLDSFGLDRSDTQREFHDCMIGACAQLIFKDDLEAELDDLLSELGVDELHSEFMAITPRRWGKTYSVAMFVVAAAFGIEGVTQAIFSTGRRASQKLLELIYTFICKIPGMKESIIKHNVETIWVQGPNGSLDIRRIFSYPSKVKISISVYYVFSPIPQLAFCEPAAPLRLQSSFFPFRHLAVSPVPNPSVPKKQIQSHKSFTFLK